MGASHPLRGGTGLSAPIFICIAALYKKRISAAIPCAEDRHPIAVSRCLPHVNK
jgi:hypothetical protein